MTIQDIRNLRLHNLLISNQRFTTVGETVHWLGAVQAQDYAGARYSLALRIAGGREADVENAIIAKSIVRTWPMRGTLHFVASEDAHWMLKLLAPRIIASSAGRYKQLALDDAVFTKSCDLLIPELEGGRQLTRAQVFELLEKAGIATADQRGMHIINHLAQTQILCHGVHNEKQPTYALLDEWVEKPSSLSEAEGLAELALRYFTSHGPATLNDFVWWTGLKVSDAKTALTSVADQLNSREIEGKHYWFSPQLPDVAHGNTAFLLPGFDEYMLGYTHRGLILDQANAGKVVPGNNGMFMPTIVINGKVEGTWKKVVKKETIQLDMYPFSKIPQTKKRLVEVQARKYAKYLNKTVSAIN